MCVCHVHCMCGRGVDVYHYSFSLHGGQTNKHAISAN